MQKRKLIMLSFVFALFGFTYAGAFVVPASCAIDTSTITEWLPIIIEFAMLGMILGLLGKFTKMGR